MIKTDEISKLNDCEHCVIGKFHKLSYKTGKHTSSEQLEYVHSDLWGSPNVTPSLSKCQYYISFVDDFSRKVWVYFLKTKDEAYNKFIEWKALVENQSGKKLKTLRTDNGLEYCNKVFDDHCKENGIMRHKTCPYTPQQNGIAERLNRTILEKVRSLLSETSLGEQFWAEATSTVVYMINRTPSTPLKFEVPEEVWTGSKPAYEHMRRFGCLVFYHVDQGKLKPRAKKGIFMGYPQGVKGYRIWSYDDKKSVISRDVTFREDILYCDVVKSVTSKGKDKVNLELLDENHTDDEQGELGESSVEGGAFSDQESDGEEEEASPGLRNYLLPRDRERQVIRPPNRFDDGGDSVVAYALTMSEMIEFDEPRTFQEAMVSKNKLKWSGAADEEIASHEKNQTWKLIERPKGQKVIGCKWIFKLKPGISGEEPRFKARLVAKGYAQVEGVDYQEVFAPVVKHTTIRLMFSMVVDQEFELEQMDVKTAFLHGDLEERILMEQPEGYAKGNKVCLLQKSLYGLKQSPRQWNMRFDKFMKPQKFSRSQFDACVYFKCYGRENYVYLLLYVDDMLIAAKDLKEVEKVKVMLNKEFEMKDLGPSQRILGINIIRDRKQGTLFLSQEAYIDKILRTFDMADSKVVQTPIGCHFKLSSTKEEDKVDTGAEMSEVPYSSVVGSLMYAMVGSRPDLAHAVGLVSRFMSSSSKEHWNAVNWILRYLKGSSNCHLTFKK